MEFPFSSTQTMSAGTETCAFTAGSGTSSWVWSAALPRLSLERPDRIENACVPPAFTGRPVRGRYVLFFAGNRRKGAQVGDQRVEVRGRELAGGIADHFAHRLCDDVAFRVDAGSQNVLQLLVAPFLEQCGREIRDVFAVGSLAPGEEAARLRPAEEIARRVAFAAMAERLHQIRAAVGDVREPREVRKGTGRKEKPLPERHEEAPAERKTHLVLLVGPGAGRERSQVGPQVAQVAIDDLGERGVGKGGEVVLAVGPLA